PVRQPRFQLLAQDLRRLDSFRTAPNASVRGLMNRVERHLLKADGKPRASDRIHPYRNEDYPGPEAGKRHRLEALRLGGPFQNTSRKQWELISLLVKAWGEGLGLATQPSIFIVGDRKQSIYRFRDADVSVLKEAGVFIDALRPGSTARRSIARSFRAMPELLAFVNDLFAEMGANARRPDDFKYDAEDRFPVDSAGPDGGPVLG